MDVVLELFDTFIADPVYAKVLPASLTTSSAFQPYIEDANSTLSLFGDSSSYVYKPATQYLYVEPSKYAYMSAWPRDNIYRQGLTLFFITWYVIHDCCGSSPQTTDSRDRVFGVLIYFLFSSLSYLYVFDKDTFKHPKYLRNQVRMEIMQTMKSMPVMAVLTAPFFLAEVRGYGKIYDTFAEEPFPYYSVLQFPLFIAFTDFNIYWIHRGLHHPWVYKALHKPHHKWIMPTPYASHAFHPVDGWSQSIPYHVFPFIFPLQKWAYVLLFIFINFWTIMIHDGEYVANSPVINGAACHTMHHLYFNYNYGQFTTLWDRMGGSYRKPNDELFRRETKMGKKEWERQTKEMESIVKTVEGDDDRRYTSEETKKEL
jgi:lathosterol oxidase